MALHISRVSWKLLEKQNFIGTTPFVYAATQWPENPYQLDLSVVPK